MNSAVAKLSAIALGGLLAISIAALILTSNAGHTGNTLRAEFKDASPLVEGMSVRVSGAVAGSVRKIELTDRGTVEVTMNLHDGLPGPRADASAAIRQQDLLGDSYLALDLGDSPEPLRGPIARERAITSPRFDEFFDIFAKPSRDGFQALTAELALALDRRGADLNEAILNLRPGFEALDDLLRELSGQNEALRSAVESSHAIGRQLAKRTRSLDTAITGVAKVAGGVAAHSGGLDASLAQLPATFSESIATMRSVRRFAEAVEPFGRTVAAGAPAFTRSARLLVDWAPDAAIGVRRLTPFLELTGRALGRSRRGLRELRGKDLNILLGPAGQLATLLEPVLGDVSEGLLGNAQGGGFGGIGAPGNDFTDPTTDPARSYITGSLIITCELFGRPVEPGCLTDALAGSATASRPRQTAKPRPGRRAPEATVPRERGRPPARGAPADGRTAAPAPLRLQLPGLVRRLLDPGTAGRPPRDIDALLDFLLAP